MSMYVFYKRPQSTELYWIWTDDEQWVGNNPIIIETAGDQPHIAHASGTPATASYYGDMLLYYKEGGSNRLMESSFRGGIWSGDQAVTHARQSDHNPVVSVLNNQLFLIYKDANSDDLWVTINSGGRWGASSRIYGGPTVSPKSNVGPSVVTYQDVLYLVYKGHDSN